MAVLDLLGRRWALGVVWALREEPRGFTQLQLDLGGMSTSVLADRLRELREAGIVAVGDGGRYVLTPDGAQLIQALEPLNRWASAWGRRAGSAP